MTKQEEIREGIAKMITASHRYGVDYVTNLDSQIASNIVAYLHSQGVVVKGASIHAGQRMHGVYRVESLVEEGD